VAGVNHVDAVIDYILTDQGRYAPYVFQCFDVSGRKADFHEPFGIEGVESVSLPEDCTEFLELQLSESLLRVMLGEQQLPVTAQDILSIQEVIRCGKCDPSDQELIHRFEKAHPRTLLYRHFSKEKNLR
jgi:hypothetical protein